MGDRAATMTGPGSLIDELTLLASFRGWEWALETVSGTAAEAAVVAIHVEDGANDALRLVGDALDGITGRNDVAAHVGERDFAVLMVGASMDDPRELKIRAEQALASVGVQGAVAVEMRGSRDDLGPVWRDAVAALGERGPAEPISVKLPDAEAAQELLDLLAVVAPED
ncbi:MAG TPA: hypothetical protein VJN50_10365 [Actinomycetota bacterium]|nr:hypothetical protein [Actinomycetota bacterium]